MILINDNEAVNSNDNMFTNKLDKQSMEIAMKQ